MSRFSGLIAGHPSDAALSDQLVGMVLRPRSKLWGIAFVIAMLGTCVLAVAITATVFEGIGLWGNNIPVAWAFAIINFVWWIGIGHAGTFISAILLLLEQKWRTSINRIAEAMTLFAVVQAGIYPLMHLGRPWFAYWLVPYPATMRVWPQFRSALPWDAAAVFTYFTISLVFWYLGLVPDLAAVRDQAKVRWKRVVYGIFALGWRGSARQQSHYRLAYGLLAGLATPLVLSVHSIVSCDFAIGLTPGWHSTIFPPFFVAGAILSGFAMVLTLVVPVRRVFKIQNVITEAHLDALAKMTLLTAWIVIYSYIIEDFCAWYSGERSEFYQYFIARPFAANSAVFWAQQVCNVLVPQALWSRRVRRSPVVLFILSIFINIGMWGERFVIIVLSLEREYLPGFWHNYHPTYVDWGMYVGTGCFFLLLFLIFLRVVPIVPVAEVKELKHELEEEG
ncbi:MAG TPA: NrfD/PsrC family molybdoenzyme membrane anchor subunit [Minicystis sp.]|nr:NrfD/PsrC family molybdoenzyme membrane anchor subunit [Minicystis sp.]